MGTASFVRFGRVLARIETLITIGSISILTACAPQASPLTVTATASSVPVATTRPTGTPITATPDMQLTEKPQPTQTPFDRDIDIIPVSGNVPFAVENSIAFYIDGGQLVIADVSSLTNPRELWRSETLAKYARGLTVADDSVYIVASNNLYIWDVSAPSQPTLADIVPFSGQEITVAPTEDLLYSFEVEGTEYRRLNTIDISQPGSPRELGTAPLDLATSYSMVIYERHLYYPHDNHIEIIDLSNPMKAVPLFSLSLPTNILGGIAVIDDYAYINTLSSGIWIFDVRNPAAPSEVYHGSRIVTSDHMNIIGKRGYFTSSICGWEPDDNGNVSGGCGVIIEVFDFAQPAVPKYLGYARIHPKTNQESVYTTRFLGDFAFFLTDFTSTSSTWYVMELAQLEP